MAKELKPARCPLCFSRYVKGTGYCPACVQLRRRELALEGREPLPSGYELTGHIRLGTVVAASPHSLLYTAWDEKKRRRLFIREYFPVRQARRGLDGCTILFDASPPEKGEAQRSAIYKNGTRYLPEKDKLEKLVRHSAPEAAREEAIAYQAAMYSIQGARERQEDSAACLAGQGFAFAVLCDGMGGMGNGEIASGHTAARFYTLYPAFCNMPQAQIMPNLLRVAREVDAEIRALRNTQGRALHCGSTLVCVVVREERIYAFHLGDSRLYRVRNGRMEQLTQDHTLYNQLRQDVARGELSQQEMDAHPKKEALTQYIGSGQKPSAIHAEAISFAPDDTLLLCSDGVYRALPEERLVQLLCMDGPVENVVRALLRAVQNENIPYQDNATAIVIRRAHRQEESL